MPMLDENVKRLPGFGKAQGACIACSAASAVLIVGQTLALARALANLWAGAALGAQWWLLAAFAACWCARSVCSYARAAYVDRYATDACGQLRRRVLENLYDAGPTAVAQRGSASVLTTLLEGIDQVRAYLALTLPKTADLMTYTVVLTVALLWLDPMSGLIAVAVVPCTVFFMRLLGGYTKENAGRQFGSYRRLANRFADSLRGMSVLKAFGAERTQAEEVYVSSEELRGRTMRTLKTATLNSLVLDLFRVFALAAVAIMLGFRLMAGSVELFPALAVLVLVPELFGALRRWANDFHAGLDGRNQLAALLGIIESMPASAQEDLSFPARPGGQPPALSFNNVGFRYPEARNASGEQPSGKPLAHEQAASSAGGETGAEMKGYRPDGGNASSNPCVHADSPSLNAAPSPVAAEPATTPAAPLQLQDVSFSVQGACRVGVVGTSGAGKTTLAQLIAGFASPSAGSVEVDGRAGATLARPSWRAHVAYLPQSPHLFNDTLRANIAFYRPDAADAEIISAAHAAGLDALLADLPQGLGTVLGEGGRGLSGGQAQRVALARVFLDNARDVVVFDEPTAHLDIETELALKASMLDLMEGRLVFFATHRMHWMRDMDLILVLEEGRIVQQGTFDELAAQPGAFAMLIHELRGDAA